MFFVCVVWKITCNSRLFIWKFLFTSYYTAVELVYDAVENLLEIVFFSLQKIFNRKFVILLKKFHGTKFHWKDFNVKIKAFLECPFVPMLFKVLISLRDLMTVWRKGWFNCIKFCFINNEIDQKRTEEAETLKAIQLHKLVFFKWIFGFSDFHRKYDSGHNSQFPSSKSTDNSIYLKIVHWIKLGNSSVKLKIEAKMKELTAESIIPVY